MGIFLAEKAFQLLLDIGFYIEWFVRKISFFLFFMKLKLNYMNSYLMKSYNGAFFYPFLANLAQGQTGRFQTSDQLIKMDVNLDVTHQSIPQVVKLFPIRIILLHP